MLTAIWQLWLVVVIIIVLAIVATIVGSRGLEKRPWGGKIRSDHTKD